MTTRRVEVTIVTQTDSQAVILTSLAVGDIVVVKSSTAAYTAGGKPARQRVQTGGRRSRGRRRAGWLVGWRCAGGQSA